MDMWRWDIKFRNSKRKMLRDAEYKGHTQFPDDIFWRLQKTKNWIIMDALLISNPISTLVVYEIDKPVEQFASVKNKWRKLNKFLNKKFE